MNILDKLLNINTVYAQAISAGQVSTETQTQLQGLFDFFLVKIPSFIAAIIVFILFWLMGKAIKGIVESRLSESMEENKEIQVLAGRTSSAVTLIIGATVALNIAGIDLTLILGAVGFGIGFALKDIIVNFLAGIMILAQKQFTIGDFIKIDGTIGKIVEIQSRATILRALEGTRVVVPNAELFTKQVISFTSNPFRRIEIVVGVEYSTDLKLAVQTCYKAIQDTHGVLLEPKPMVLVTEFGESSINLVVRAWVESRGAWLKIKSELAIAIKAEFDAVNINIPFPIRTVVFDKDAKADQQKMLEEQIAKADQMQGEQKPEWVAQGTNQVEQQGVAQPQAAQAPQQEVQPQQEPVQQPQMPVNMGEQEMQPIAVTPDGQEVPVPPVVKPKGETMPSKGQTGSAFLSQQ